MVNIPSFSYIVFRIKYYLEKHPSRLNNVLRWHFHSTFMLCMGVFLLVVFIMGGCVFISSGGYFTLELATLFIVTAVGLSLFNLLYFASDEYLRLEKAKRLRYVKGQDMV